MYLGNLDLGQGTPHQEVVVVPANVTSDPDVRPLDQHVGRVGFLDRDGGMVQVDVHRALLAVVVKDGGGGRARAGQGGAKGDLETDRMDCSCSLSLNKVPAGKGPTTICQGNKF